MIYLAQRGHIHDLPPSKHFLLFDFQAPGLISSDYGRYAVEDPGGALRDVFVWPLIVLRWRLVCSSVFSCWHIYALFLKRFVLCRSFCFIESCAKGASRICAAQWRWDCRIPQCTFLCELRALCPPWGLPVSPYGRGGPSFRRDRSDIAVWVWVWDFCKKYRFSKSVQTVCLFFRFA